MSEQAIEFLEEWISDKVRPSSGTIAPERQAEILAAKCESDAARVGVPIEEIVEEVGDLEDLMVARLEDAATPDPAFEPDASPSRSKPERNDDEPLPAQSLR